MQGFISGLCVLFHWFICVKTPINLKIHCDFICFLSLNLFYHMHIRILFRLSLSLRKVCLVFFGLGDVNYYVHRINKQYDPTG